MKVLVEQECGSVKMICETLGVPRSTYYYRCQQGNESQLEADLETVAGQYPKYGTRRLTQQLRRAPYHYQINRKRVQGIMRQKRLLRPLKRAKYRTTDSQHPYPRYPNLVAELEITQPEQVWFCDITYVRGIVQSSLP